MASSPMNPLDAALRRIAAELDARSRRWALVGGLAVSARAEPRTTRDIDLAVAVGGDRDAESLVYDLQACGYAVLAVVEQTDTHRLATVRLKTALEATFGVVVDLLFASSGFETEIADGAERLEIVPGLDVPVATVGHLIALKVLARNDRTRPQDLDDIRALFAEANEADLAEARTALHAIEERGFHRGKRLLDDLEELLRERSAQS